MIVRKFLRLELANPDVPGDVTEMRFLLNASDIADRFSALVDLANRSPHEVVVAWGMSVGSEQLPTALYDLNSNIDSFNRLNTEGLNINHQVDESTLSRRILNAIHEEFERCSYHLYKENQERKRSSDPGYTEIIDYLENINHNVHLLESIVDKVTDKGSIKSYFTARLKKRDVDDFYDTPLKDEDYDLFTLDENFGDVYLNYATTGKNLHQIFVTEDVDMLRLGSVARPQQIITPGIIALFNSTKKTHDQELKRFNQWWDANRISAYGYSKNDKRNGLGFIKLGELYPTSPIDRFYDRSSGSFNEVRVVEYFCSYSRVMEMTTMDG
jgi:hypothetical protein